MDTKSGYINLPDSLFFNADGSMKHRINGCYTKNGSRPLSPDEIAVEQSLYGDLAFRIGTIPTEDDGLSVDLVKNGNVFAWEHGIFAAIDTNDRKQLAFIGHQIAINRLKEMGL